MSPQTPPHTTASTPLRTATTLARQLGAPGPGTSIHLGADLTDAGAHPAAWRTSGSQGAQLFDPERLDALVATAQRGLLDLVAFDDAFSLQPHARGVRGRLDAALVAARLAPRSSGIGLVATIDTTHTEPFHVSKALATIDHVSRGRAAWQVSWSTDEAAASAFRREPAQDRADAIAEADEATDVVGRLWDSWEDDAEIRDAATGRFVDRDKLHHVDHEGIRFAVKGPSITPRPPQGRPPVVVRASDDASIDLAGRRADVVRVHATTPDEARDARAAVLDAARRAGRDPRDVRVLVDAFVVLADDDAAARARLDLLQDLQGVEWETGSLTHVGTPARLAATIAGWSEVGATDGFHLRPASLSTDLTLVVDRVVPALQAAGVFRTSYPGTTLRETLGLARPVNVYAASA
ncbi:LLM class flavin-dependent oxidoreductase [Cellulomonas sp. HZM]|uniref:LLM class flavin-dependent oxidoreductase n=1 Tax=Cellulomonas sp. HZM TaxID=1454010 RepID=UPI0009DE6CBC|nr:LLM class flavin-dependent oxidoreductase [Cellulomonas sp. HZM]